jgi:hypothetical protein
MLKEYKFDYSNWDSNRPPAANSKISFYLDIFNVAIAKNESNRETYEKLFFAELFSYYANKQKGTVALDILSDEKLAEGIIVPEYIKEGLEWLSK